MGMARGMTTVTVVAVLAVPGAGPATGQGVDRIWGQVETVGGEVHAGFIRWDRNEAAWADILDGTRRIPRETAQAWREAGRGRADRERRIEFMGFTLIWEEDDLPTHADSGIRFGHLRELRVLDDRRAELLLRSGERVEMEEGGTDLGGGMRELLVEVPGRGTVEVEWEDLEGVRFEPAPPSARPGAERLHGTVEDRWGNRFTGYLGWGTDEALASDTLDGAEEDRDRRIPFRDIAAIEREDRGSRVVLRDGTERVLTGSSDVGRGHRGVQVSDPALGGVEVEWRDFRSVRFHPPARPVGYDAFTGGHRLEGTVMTRDDRELQGWIVWDADEAWSWEMLDGSLRDVAFQVEFGAIRSIARGSSRSAVVTLLDGRVFELEGSNDVNDDNKGILVAVQGDPAGEGSGEVVWEMVEWDDLHAVHFRHRE